MGALLRLVDPESIFYVGNPFERFAGHGSVANGSAAAAPTVKPSLRSGPELRTVEPELQTLVPAQSAGPAFEDTVKLVRAGNATSADAHLQLVTWFVGEKVGWVGEGHIVAIGEHGKIMSLNPFDMTAVVIFPSWTWRLYVREL